MYACACTPAKPVLHRFLNFSKMVSIISNLPANIYIYRITGLSMQTKIKLGNLTQIKAYINFRSLFYPFLHFSALLTALFLRPPFILPLMLTHNYRIFCFRFNPQPAMLKMFHFFTKCVVLIMLGLFPVTSARVADCGKIVTKFFLFPYIQTNCHNI